MKWIIMSPCDGQYDKIGCWIVTSDGSIPATFDSKEDAWREIADDMILDLQYFIEGSQSLEDTSFSTDSYAVPVEIKEDGSMYILLEMAGPNYVLLDNSIPIWEPD